MIKHDTLTSDEIARIIKSGRPQKSRSLFVFAEPLGLKSGQKRGKIAYIAPKRLGNAVCRNRSKRVLRAGISLALSKEPNLLNVCDNNNIILMARADLKRVSSYQVAGELVQLLVKLEKGLSR